MMEEQAPTIEVDKQLREIRHSLLDLTMRNRVLNFRPTKARTIRIIDEIPAEIYDYLVLKERAMEFRARPAGITTESLEADEAERLVDETAALLWHMPTSELAERPTDRFLQTPLESAALQQRLFKISQQARTILNEQGYTALHLILGFLEWTDETPTTTARRAPLILIPVELERTRAGAAFKLRWTKEDLRTNISLQARLSEQFVTLPDFEMTDDKVGVDWYLESVVLAVSGKRGWRVVTDIYLDFISFTKFVLYKDLDPAAWPDRSPPAHHSLVRAILSPGGLEKPAAAAQVSDDALPAHCLYTVLDADSSQAEVIEAARRGANLVVEGPPGTGKSQTIVNLIAELMASGKTILFVSEKAAALQVVKERIHKVGLGDFCLELHSRKANKRDVLMELEAAVYRQPQLASPAPGDDNEYETLKAELNGYACALRAPCGRIQLSVFALYCLRERARRHFAAVGRAMPRVKLAGVEDCDQQQWSDALMKLAALGQMLAAIRPLATHPWRGCDPEAVMPSDEFEIALLIKRCRADLEHLLACLKNLTAICAMQPITNLEQTADALGAAKLIISTKSTSRRVMLNEAWKNPGEPVKALIAELQQTQRELEEAAGVYRAHALNESIAGLLAEYQYLSTKRLRFFLPRYHRLKRIVAGLYRGTPPPTPQIINDLRRLADTLRRRKDLQRGGSEGSALFGQLWQGEQSDVGALREFAEWVIAVRRCIGDNIFADEVIDLIEAGVAGAEIEQAAATVSDAVIRFKQAREALNQRLRIADEEIFSARADLVTFSAFAEQLNIWQSEIARLQRWAQYRALVRGSMKTMAALLLESIAGDQVDPEDVVECFKGNFADELLRTAFTTRPELAGFVGDLHESKIDRFSELDCRLIQANRQRLAEKLYAARPQLLGGASPSSEAGMLLGEFARKRRLMPIRKLMLHAGALVQRFKPCFMMSPLSVAQFLDPAGVRFDVIIFDEASQVKIEDALGALLRASQCIVLGDTRQLPPTSFFDSLVESGDDGEADTPARISDVESLLHQCQMIFDVKRLHWHYRSQHESLIAVSNQEFYNNSLVIHPSPEQRPEWLGLHFVHLPETIYDRGRSSINRQEAKAVAEAALDHFRRHPRQSLGVGTFNIKQQQAIREEIELQRRQHPEMEAHFKADGDEPFFVKNLETIQGDERDVILLSLGFGFDAERRLSLNFGPLNQPGGERRLNVLISRARKRCVVFTNFRAADLAVRANAPAGVQALKVFLEYAETRTLRHVTLAAAESGSEVEDAIYEFIRGSGYEVHRQVGCGSFRLNLAIVDPRRTSHYLLGIECDDAKFYTSPAARDRDRLRQQFLTALGWNLHRAWSTDWYRHRDEGERRLLDALRRAQEPRYDAVISCVTPALSASLQTTATARSADELRRAPVQTRLLEEAVALYQTCLSLTIPVYGELHDQPVERLAAAVTQVVAVEGPVHLEEAIRRIRSLWGVKRAGQRIQQAINRAVYFAELNGGVQRRGAFLWPTTEHEVAVRRRQGDPPPRIDLICDEEIAAAVRLILKHQFATIFDDLVVQCSRLFGIQGMPGLAATRIRSIVMRMIESGQLQRRADGRIRLT